MKKAFTLVELLSVIVLLGVIAIILIPNFNNVLKSSEEDLYNKQISVIKTASKLWISKEDNKIFLINNEEWPYIITLGDLIDAGLLEENIKNPKKDEYFSDSTLIYIYYENGSYTFEVDENTLSNDLQIITLNGNRNYEVEVNENYNELGVIAKDINGNNITNKVETTYYKNGLPTEVINTKELANYTVKYSVEYTNINNKKEKFITFRRVKVVDTTSPIITCSICNNNVIEIESIENYTLPELEATDNYDKEISILKIGSFSSKIPGEKRIVYVATDSSGNSSNLEIKFIIKDITPPTITNISLINNNDDTVTYIIDANDTGSGIKEYSIDGGITWQKSNQIKTLQKDIPRIFAVKDNAGNITTKQLSDTFSSDYAYKGTQEIFIAPRTGNYKIELWGAQGGTSGSYAGGKGGYTAGIIQLEENEKLYIYVGGQGKTLTSGSTYYASGGYNGGGIGGNNSGAYSFGGGGATDIRYFGNHEPSTSELTWNSTLGLNSRIMIAAGGSGAVNGQSAVIAGYGGGLTGGKGHASSGTYADAGYLNSGATQTSGGVSAYSSSKNGTFGMALQSTVSGWGGGGGGGYYGGSMGHGTGGSGGSSYISGHKGCIAITSSTSRTPKCSTATDITCSYHYSGKRFIDTLMIAGNATMPNKNGSTEVGHTGNGFARITYVGSEVFVKFEYVKSTTEVFGKGKITISSSKELSNENKYMYYISTSNTELKDGQWTEYINDNSFYIKRTSGLYYVWVYPVKDVEGHINDNYISITNPYVIGQINVNSSLEYAYSGSYRNFIVPKDGIYKIELWGAQGGGGGNGAYTTGKLELKENESFYVYVGGVGKSASTTVNAGGYNGGGSGGNNSSGYSYGGGGGTDIRYFGSTTPTSSDLTWDSTLGLNSRIMIAAGGGGKVGNQSATTSGYGGALTGGRGGASSGEFSGSGYYTNGATQVGVGTSNYSSSKNGAFGMALQSSVSGWGGGGGGGYYGGAQGYGTGGSGGSSYISGYKGSVAITSSTSRTPKTGCTTGTTDITCSYHYSNKIFEETNMIAGNASMPSTSGSTETGHSGNGYAKITYVGSPRPIINVKQENSTTTIKATISITSSNELSSENKYQYYLSTSATELTGGNWKEYTSNVSFTINGTETLYLWIYPVKDILGSINDNKTYGEPYVIKIIQFCSNIPEYTYYKPNTTTTANHQYIDDGNGNWRIKFLESGTFTLTSALCSTIDIFLVGGGGGGGSYNGSGGGGGYTSTAKNITLESNMTYSVVIGKGGAGAATGKAGTAGVSSSFNDKYVANGGKGGGSGSAGGAGGSGGGSSHNTGNGTGTGGKGGSYGNSGTSVTYSGGGGQGTTTCEFGEGTLSGCNSGVTAYSGGGGGSAEAKGSGGAGGAGGGGKGGTGYVNGNSASDNTGGGGGGAMESGYTGGNGGSGIVIIRKSK